MAAGGSDQGSAGNKTPVRDGPRVMTRAILAISGSAAALLPHPFAALGHALDKLRHRLFVGYHPERHYMRGPGPAWRAKHDSSLSV